MNKQKILITGGAGFIGSHLAKCFVEKKQQITIIDNLSRGSAQNIATIKNQIQFKRIDLRCERGLQRMFEGHDTVYNLAALNTGIDYDTGRTHTMFEENMLLQLIPLKVASKTKSVRRFTQISSASVYSRLAMEHHIPTPEDADTTSPEPSKLGYALAKQMGEQLARWYAQNTNLQTNVVRFINVYGEGDHCDELGHVIPSLIRKFLQANHSVSVFGNGKQGRSFVYVKDVVSALEVIMQKGKNGEVYNVDGSDEYTVRDLIAVLQKRFAHKNLSIHYDTTKPAGSSRRILDTTKLRGLGWKPKYTLATKIDDLIADIQQRLVG